MACFCWVPPTDHGFIMTCTSHHLTCIKICNSWHVDLGSILFMFVMAWSGWPVQKVTGVDYSFPQHKCRRNDFTSLNCLNTKAKFSACLPAGLWAWAETLIHCSGVHFPFYLDFRFYQHCEIGMPQLDIPVIGACGLLQLMTIDVSSTLSTLCSGGASGAV